MKIVLKNQKCHVYFYVDVSRTFSAAQKLNCAGTTMTMVSLVITALAALLLPTTSAELHLRYPKGLAPDKVATENLYTPQANQDRILDLPGLDYDPGFNQFSGYLNVSPEHDRNIFYWFTESQSAPKNDPIIFWTNGGPGCSGLVGFGTEHGPFIIDKDGTLSENPYSWNKVASILYVEIPAGVGFSYSNVEDDYTTGDKQTAADNYVAIREFLKRFPEKQANDFYIASESFGGHYMPQLTKEILTRNTDQLINFRGFMVGNPYVDPHTNRVTQFQAYYHHGLIAKPLFDEWMAHCQDQDVHSLVLCEKLTLRIYDSWGGSINHYALDYPVCEEEGPDSTARGLSSQAFQILSSINSNPPFLPHEDVFYPCGQEHLTKYMNREDVQTALHVRNATVHWTICAHDLVKYSEVDHETPQMDLYKELVEMGKKNAHSLNMLVYSGDDDSVCSTSGTQAWIYDLGVDPMDGHLWKAWKVEEQTAGFVTHFDLGKEADATFTFATVHGAGHEVPTFRPMEALQMLKIYLRGEW